MSVHDSYKYKKAKKDLTKYKKLLQDLDIVADKLYDNLEYSEIWNLIGHLEEVRVEYYIRYQECLVTTRSKGKINE